MANVTTGTVRNQSFNLFTAAAANGDSPIFALFSKPIEPHYITIIVQFLGGATGTVTASLGILDANGNIQWQTAGSVTTTGPISISGKVAQFLKLTIASIAVGTITADAIAA